ncbi:hypothetical protein ACIA8O_16165 [Kitasatospora sp. NPDC051853]|uniref:hypothetical protein n=1 Tax=Kitasatospora sp. NPDC051853 TaxID=3364058 RepID=UPI003788DED1
MRRRVIRTAAAGLLAAAATIGLIPTAQAEELPYPTTKCERSKEPWAGTVDINQGQRLTSGQRLVAKDNLSTLVMQPDGNLVLSLINDKGGPNHPIWHSGTWGHPGAYAKMQWDGNFVVYEANGGEDTGGALWSTGTWGQRGSTAWLTPGGGFMVSNISDPGWSAGTYDATQALCADRKMNGGAWTQSASVWLFLQPDGNVTIHSKRDDRLLWASGTYGNPGAMLVMHGDGNLVVYPMQKGQGTWVNPLWSTGTYGNQNAYALLQDDGNFVVYRSDGGPDKGGALWATGTWGQ